MRPRARRPSPRARTIAARASSVSTHRCTVARDGDDLVEGERADAHLHGGRDRSDQWSGMRLMRRFNVPCRGQRVQSRGRAVRLGSQTWPAPCRTRGNACARISRRAASAAAPPGAGRAGCEAPLKPKSKKAEQRGHPVADCARSADAPGRPRTTAGTRSGARPRPRSRFPSCRTPRTARAGPGRRHQLAAVPQGHGHPAEAGAGLADADRRRALRDPRADQRPRLLSQPVSRQPGRRG